ncbi:MAG: outer membrane beta-barrel protein [Nitrospirota bacterium]|nr:MAG: outer membrane beta-barrel protein [Nitrospirota bacterium]
MKSSKYLIILSVLIVILIIPFMANAVEDDNRFYTNVKAGVYIPFDRQSNASYDTGISTEFSAGYHIFPSFTVEAGVGYFKTQITIDQSNADGSVDVSVIPLTLAAKWINNYERSSFYLGGGIGAYYEMIDGEVDMSSSGTFKFDDQVVDFGVHVLFGFLYNLSQNVQLGLEWRPMYIIDTEFESTNSFGTATLKPDLGGRLLSGVLSVRF